MYFVMCASPTFSSRTSCLASGCLFAPCYWACAKKTSEKDTSERKYCPDFSHPLATVSGHYFGLWLSEGKGLSRWRHGWMPTLGFLAQCLVSDGEQGWIPRWGFTAPLIFLCSKLCTWVFLRQTYTLWVSIVLGVLFFYEFILHEAVPRLQQFSSSALVVN